MTDTNDAPRARRIIDTGYKPRPHFVPFHERKQRFACIVAHRRAGKTLACVHELQHRALHCSRDRPRMAYLAPYLHQAKAVAWDHLRAVAAPLRGDRSAKVNESELRVDYANGAQVRLFGADNPDALRGMYLDGVVLDEYADMDPRVWPEIIHPMLLDRGGFAVFIGTPKGRNAFYEQWRKAQSDPEWFTLMLRASETGLIAQSELDTVRRSLTEEQYAQEFECSFEAAITGAYYGRQMAEAERTRRVATVPYEPSAAVWTAWDLGIRDSTAIWFVQVVGRETRLIDYYETSGMDLGHYARELFKRPYSYAGHVLPHDARAKELGTGKSRTEVLQSLGLRNISYAPMHSIEDGIHAVRMRLPMCWFDAEKCARGIEALKIYRADYNDRFQVQSGRPVHDWSSHAADAFRYLAMGLDQAPSPERVKNFNRKLVYPPRGYW